MCTLLHLSSDMIIYIVGEKGACVVVEYKNY